MKKNSFNTNTGEGRGLSPVLCIISLFTAILTYHSAAGNGIKDSLLFSQNHWSLTASPLLVNRPSITLEKGDISLERLHTIGFNVGAFYHFNINTRYAVTAGLEWGQIPYGYKFRIDGDKYYSVLKGHSYNEKGAEYIITHLQLPVLLSSRFELKPRLYFQADAGVVLDYFPSGSTRGGITNTFIDTSKAIRVFEIALDVNETDKPRLAYSAGIGTVHKLKNDHLVQLQLAYTYSPKDIIHGYYLFLEDTEHESSGDYLMNASHAALKMVYTFTRAKRFKTRQ